MAGNEWTKKERVRMATLDRIVLEDESYNLTGEQLLNGWMISLETEGNEGDTEMASFLMPRVNRWFQ